MSETNYIPFTRSDYFNMVREQYNDDLKIEQDKIKNENYIRDKAIKENYDYVSNYMIDGEKRRANRSKFLENAKLGLLSSALYKVYKESFKDEFLSESDTKLMKNLVTQFISEQGPSKLMNEWKYKNMLLAEMGKLCKDTYQIILDNISESENKKDENNEHNPEPKDVLKLDKSAIDSFYDNLALMDTSQASDLINNRTKDALNDFIDQNAKIRQDCDEIINNAKERMENAKSQEQVNQIQQESTRRIKKITNFRTNKNPFHYMVESLTKSVFSDPNLKAKYINESSTTVNMDEVVHNAKIIYQFLETVNTLEIVDENYIKNYIMSAIDE